MAHERRIHPRVKCPLTYQVAIEEYPDIIGKVLNLSLGGITFVFPEKLTGKSVLNFVVTCPVTPFNLGAHGEIIWSKNAAGKDNFISGAIFPYLSEDEVLQLRRVLSMFSSKVEEDRRQEERRLKLALIEKDLRRDQRRKKAR